MSRKPEVEITDVTITPPPALAPVQRVAPGTVERGPVGVRADDMRWAEWISDERNQLAQLAKLAKRAKSDIVKIQAIRLANEIVTKRGQKGIEQLVMVCRQEIKVLMETLNISREEAIEKLRPLIECVEPGERELVLAALAIRM